MNDLAPLINKIKQLETEIERLKRVEYPTGGGGGGVTDHGQLTGLGDDDHPQYRLVADAIDHGALGGLSDNDHPQYLLTTGKAADADKLDGIDSTGFVNTTGTQTVGGTKTFSSIPVLPASNPTTANQAVRKGFADATYLGKTAKAADSDKLDGLDSSAFLQTPSWTSWTPTQSGWTALPTGTYRYFQVGKMCFFAIDITAGTSNGTDAALSLPVAAKSGTYWGGVNGMAMNNGSVLSVATKWYIDAVTDKITFSTDMNVGVWTASGTKRIRCEGFYEIA